MLMRSSQTILAFSTAAAILALGSAPSLAQSKYTTYDPKKPDYSKPFYPPKVDDKKLYLDQKVLIDKKYFDKSYDDKWYVKK